MGKYIGDKIDEVLDLDRDHAWISPRPLSQ
jgi:hypothetical protein